MIGRFFVIAVVLSYVLGLPYGWSLFIGILIDASIGIYKIIKETEGENSVATKTMKPVLLLNPAKRPEVDSEEYLARYAPKA